MKGDEFVRFNPDGSETWIRLGREITRYPNAAELIRREYTLQRHQQVMLAKRGKRWTQKVLDGMLWAYGLCALVAVVLAFFLRPEDRLSAMVQTTLTAGAVGPMLLLLAMPIHLIDIMIRGLSNQPVVYTVVDKRDC